MSSNISLNKQITANVGLYYCSYQLSLRGWNVMPTSRNAQGVDIIAYNADASRYIGIQIKTLSKKDPVPLGTSIDKILGDFWIILNNATISPTSFILLPSEVKTGAHRAEKNGKVSFWLQPKAYNQPIFQEAWARIGNGSG